jgi:DNA repair exonuclease SbcCD ATPase subunit
MALTLKELVGKLYDKPEPGTISGQAKKQMEQVEGMEKACPTCGQPMPGEPKKADPQVPK